MRAKSPKILMTAGGAVVASTQIKCNLGSGRIDEIHGQCSRSVCLDNFYVPVKSAINITHNLRDLGIARYTKSKYIS